MEQKNYFSAEDVARRFSISRAGVLNLAKQGKFPQPLRIGRSLRWNAIDVENFEKQQLQTNE